MIHVTLAERLPIEEVDSEIVVVAGCALGLVAPHQPPHVLHVDPGTVMAAHGVQSDDLLVSVDGQETRKMGQQDVAKAIQQAHRLAFERPSTPPEGVALPGEALDGSGRNGPAARLTAVPGSDLADGGSTARRGSRRQRSRSRSRRRRRHEGEPRPGRPPASWPSPPPEAGRPPGPGWPPEGCPPPMGGPPPWVAGPPPGGKGGFRPPFEPWSRPPEQWHGPPPERRSPPRRREGERREHRGLRLDRNESGGATLVAERVPPTANNMDVLNEYFGTFGPVVALQVNHSRHEAIISMARVEDAEEALRWPVLNDPSIGLRPWRSKAGQRAPHEAPEAYVPPAPGQPPPGSGAPPGSFAPPAGASAPHPAVTDGERPSAPTSGNVVLDLGQGLQKKKQREELEDKRKALLQGLTDQLKLVMTKISDPKTDEKGREKLQGILAAIKEKISALTPKPTPEAVRQRMAGMRPPAPGSRQAGAGRCALRLQGLPDALRSAEARVRQALGDVGIEAVQAWSEDGSACIVRFADRRPAEVAMQAQKVWGFVAEWHEDDTSGEGPLALTAAALAEHTMAEHTPKEEPTEESRERAALLMKEALAADGALSESAGTEEMEPDAEDADDAAMPPADPAATDAYEQLAAET